MKFALLFLITLSTACLGVEFADDEEYPVRPGGGGENPGILPGGNDNTDDVHCPTGWLEFAAIGVCYRSATAIPVLQCPSGFVEYTHHNLSPGLRVCHCPTGHGDFIGNCTPQDTSVPDFTDCPTSWTPTGTRGICGINSVAFWREPLTPPKSFKSYLSSPIRVYISRTYASTPTSLAVVNDTTNTLTVLTDDLSCSYGISPWIGKTEVGWDVCAFLDQEYPVVPAPNYQAVSWLMFAWDD